MSLAFPMAVRNPDGHLQYIGLIPAPDAATAVSLGRAILGDLTARVEMLGQAQPASEPRYVTPAMIRAARAQLVAELQVSVDLLIENARRAA